MGKGGFGEVRLAEHRETGKKVALKIFLKSKLSLDEIGLCRHEIDTLKLCQHPNILRIYDVLENSEHLFIAMELLNGGTLLERLQKNPSYFTEQRVAKIVSQIAIALRYMHNIGVVHRDIKPDNILFADDKEDSIIKIADFGLATYLTPKETCKDYAGTIDYSAPELLMGLPYDKTVDIWGLGILTYMLLCGKLPIDSKICFEVKKRQILMEEFDTEFGKWSHVSGPAKDFVKSMRILL